MDKLQTPALADFKKVKLDLKQEQKGKIARERV